MSAVQLHSTLLSAILPPSDIHVDAGVIPDEFLEELLSRVDIVEIVGSRVGLKKTGKDYTGLCPFHTEKSPSFSVSQDKQFYYCFGCQEHGSALKFLQEFEGMDFVTAVESLAAHAGMQVPRQDTGRTEQASRQRRTVYEILDKAAGFYRDQLRHHDRAADAVSYLKGRGVSGEIARDFGIGFAPPGWDNLQLALATSNFDRDLLIQSGMLVENEERDKTYDRFRDRVVFPIRDLRGRTIAFGGRIMGEGKPKYLNSPETPVFHKGRELYGLYEARRRTPKLEQVIVVEGYMDVVALAQHGLSYSVATLGTATTEDHIERLYRLVPRIVFCFDGDDAGRSAAWKALNTVASFLRDGRSAAFLFLPDGEDPDSLVRAEGSDKFELRLSRATSFASFVFEHLEASRDMETMEGKAAMSKDAIPLIHRIPEGVFRQLMIDELSTRTGLSTERLISVSTDYREDPRTIRQAPDMAKSAMDEGVSDASIQTAISMLLLQPELAHLFEAGEYEGLVADPGCKLLIEIRNLILDAVAPDPVWILSQYHGRAEFEYLRGLANREHLLDVSQFADEFTGILRSRLAVIDAQARRGPVSDLLAKPFADLTEAERTIIRDYHKTTP